MKSRVVIAFGGNVGDTERIFEAAKEALTQGVGPCIKSAKLYKTAPMTKPGLDSSLIASYLNSAALFATNLHVEEILHHCVAVEGLFGRVRDPNQQWTPRTLDLDIIDFDNKIYKSTDVSVPHPQMTERDFVLQPLFDLLPDYRHPGTNETISVMLSKVARRYILH